MADLAGIPRAQNAGGRPVPVVGGEDPPRMLTPTTILKQRKEREEARRREQEGIERERRRRSEERRAAAQDGMPVADVGHYTPAAGGAGAGARRELTGEFQRAQASSRRTAPEPIAVADNPASRPPQRRGAGQPPSTASASVPVREADVAVRRRPVGEPSTASQTHRTSYSTAQQPSQAATSRTTTSIPPPQAAPQPSARTAPISAPAAAATTQTQSQTGPVPAATSRSQGTQQPANGQPKNGTVSSFPHAFERWEQLSAHWEGLTSYWIKRLEGNSEEISNQPINQQLARQVTDLSVAGANLFHAVVELQRLRASTERKFQRWFYDTRSEQQRTQGRIAELEADLTREREGRSREVRNDAIAEAERIQIQRIQEERARTDKVLKEMKRELQISRDEARRGWEEIGRMEQAERDRTYCLKRGQPTSVGGVQVVPMLQVSASRQTSSSRGRGEDPNYSPYEVARSDTDTDPYAESLRDRELPPVPQIPASAQSYQVPTTATSGSQDERIAVSHATLPYRPAPSSATGASTSQSHDPSYGQPVSAPFYQQSGTGTALHDLSLLRNAEVDERSHGHSEISEDDYELDSQGRVRRDPQGNPVVARRPVYREDPQHYTAAQYSGEGVPAAPAAPAGGYGSAPVSNGEIYYAPPAPDYTGSGYGWEGIPRHQHPTRLSDVLEEEDERSRTSPSRTSERSRGVH